MRTICSFAWLSILALPIFSFGSIYQVVQLSEPAGFLSQTDAIHQENNHPSVSPTLSSNGYAFGYWTIDDVRVAGPDGRSLTQVSSVIQAASTYKAHYFQENVDSDSDGIMDWFEYRMFGDLSRGPGDDPDGDGFTNQHEDQLGQDPLIKDLVRDGGLSSRTSTAFVYADTSMVKATIKSDPAGFVTQSENFLALNSNVSTASLNGETNGYHFAYWSVNGVRQAAPNGTASSQVDLNVSVTSEIIAHYLPSNEDSDSDGVMDWFELNQFGSLSHGPNDDPDGDGFSNKLEGELGQEARIKDFVRDGGLSSRTSTAFVYADTSMVQATIKSDPAGFVTQTENFLALNSNVSTASLNGETNGYHFAYWSVNGVRQTAPNGTSASQVDMNLTATSQIVAHYLPSTEDSDSDGVMDWFELHQFGNLFLGPDDDPDGDGFSNKREGELGQEARVKDLVRDGGLSSRVSSSILYFLQVNNPPDGLDLNDTIVHANKPTGELVGIFQPSDPDDPNGQNAYQLSFLDGNGSTDKNLFTISGMNLLSTTSLQVGKYSVNIRVMDYENASFDKNFTIQAIHDPNKDDDNDGLTYAQEQALGTSDSNPDTDGDGFTDGQEVAAGKDPHNPLLFPGTSYVGQNLVGQSFNSQDLRNADFSDANLTGADFWGANLTGAKFSNADLTKANFRRATVDLANFENATLWESKFTWVDLRNVDLSKMNLSGVWFDDATTWPVGFDPKVHGALGPEIDLRGFDLSTFGSKPFENADLSRANLSGMNLSGRNFFMATLNSIDLSHSVLEDIFLRRASMQDANLTSANLARANLTAVNLTGAILADANLTGAWFDRSTTWPNGFDALAKGAIGPGKDFRGEDLSSYDDNFFTKDQSADFSFANFSSNNLQNNSFFLADLIEANFSFSNLTNANFRRADLTKAIFQGANLTGANLTATKLIEADFRDSNLTSAQFDTDCNLSGAIYNLNTTWPTGVDPVAAGALSRNPPTDLNSTAPLSVAENQPVGTIVGGFTATDPDANASLSFSLVDGNGSSGNYFFVLDTNGTLTSAVVFDYENNESNYSIRVRIADEYNASLEKAFVISLLNEIEDLDGDGAEDFYDADDDNDGFSDAEEIAYGSDPRDEHSVANAAPNNLELNGTGILENQSVGTIVGQLIGNDPDYNATLTYGFADGNGSDDNSLFIIDENASVRSTSTFDYETDEHNYSISVRVTDEHNFSIKQSFAIHLLNLVEDFDQDGIEDHYDPDDDNDGFLDTEEIEKGTDPFDHESVPNAPPSSLTLNNLRLFENLPAGSIIGELNATDPDANSTLTIALVDGNVSNDHDLFIIDENKSLRTTRTFDYETDDWNYSILVAVTDEHNLSIERTFTIPLLNVVEDLDSDGIEDFYDKDDDNDGFPDNYEIGYGSNPRDANSTANLVPDLLDLNGSVVEWDSNAGTVVGQFAVNDPDTYATLSLQLADTNETDHDLFTIDENYTLITTQTIPYERALPALLINVKLSDEWNASLEKTFEIVVTAKPIFNDSNQTVDSNNTIIDGNQSIIENDNLLVDGNQSFANWWGNERPDADGWVIDSVMGTFRPHENGWLYHLHLGWLYASPVEDDSLWIWSTEHRWLWTRRDMFPFAYRWEDANWLYFFLRSDGSFYTFNYATESYE